jgi:hypothetical protein
VVVSLIPQHYSRVCLIVTKICHFVLGNGGDNASFRKICVTSSPRMLMSVVLGNKNKRIDAIEYAKNR